MRPSHFINPLRLARLTAWALLWLMKHALLIVSDCQGARDDFRWMKGFVARLIVLRAANMAHAPTRPRRRFTSAPRGFVQRRHKGAVVRRAAIGSRLRRALRGRSAGARLSALLNALFDAAAHARRLAVRLSHGLTRLAPILPLRPPSDALHWPAAARVCFTDSS